jgi:hypothetical protein
MKALLTPDQAVIRLRRDLRHAVTVAKNNGLDAKAIIKADFLF